MLGVNYMINSKIYLSRVGIAKKNQPPLNFLGMAGLMTDLALRDDQLFIMTSSPV
jgi:hypothetical protein